MGHGHKDKRMKQKQPKATDDIKMEKGTGLFEGIDGDNDDKRQNLKRKADD